MDDDRQKVRQRMIRVLERMEEDKDEASDYWHLYMTTNALPAWIKMLAQSDVPTGSREGIANQEPSAENLDFLFPFDFSWVIKDEALVLTFYDPDRALLALNRLQKMRNIPVKAVAVDPG